MFLKSLVVGSLIACALIALPPDAFAKDYPTKPIHLLNGYPPGATTDIIARQYANQVEQTLGVPIVIENRPGAAQLLAIGTLINARPDGYTLLIAAGGALSQAPAIRDDLPYKTMEDFVPVALLATAPGVFTVNKDLPVKDMRELIAYAKTNPGKLNFGSSGVGTASHLQLELLKHITGVDIAHISYQGASQINEAIIKGEIDIGVGPINSSLEGVLAGQVRALAVTGEARSKLLPDVPALSELGIPELSALDPYSYYMVLAPKGTPQPIIDKVNAAFNKASSNPETEKFLIERGFYPMAVSVEAGRDYALNDFTIWSNFRKTTGFKYAK